MLPSYRDRQQSDVLAITGHCDLLSPETRGEMSATLCRHPKKAEGLKWAKREGKARPGEDREASLFLSHVPTQVTVSFTAGGLRECVGLETDPNLAKVVHPSELSYMFSVVSQKKSLSPKQQGKPMSNLENKGKKNVFTLT